MKVTLSREEERHRTVHRGNKETGAEIGVPETSSENDRLLA